MRIILSRPTRTIPSTILPAAIGRIRTMRPIRTAARTPRLILRPTNSIRTANTVELVFLYFEAGNALTRFSVDQIKPSGAQL